MQRKRILMTAVLLVFVMCALLVPASAADLVGSGTCGDNLTWTLDSAGTLTISGTGWMNDSVPWKNQCESVKQVIIDDGVVSIADYAFDYCLNLTDVTIPESVTHIGEYVFRDCRSLTGITLPESVTDIGIGMFYDCRSLVDVTLPEGVTRISRNAFYRCSSLTDIMLPESLNTVGESVFYGCSSLTGIVIPDGVPYINGSMFDWCSSLTDVTIPESVTWIGSYAFRGCSSLTGITIPESVTQIDGSAFSDCSSLTSIVIPEGVTYIQTEIFSGCSSLTSVTLPESATEIGTYAFLGCSSLKSIDLPDGVAIIGPASFADCTALTSINLPAGLTELCDGALRNCSNLESIVFQGDSPIIGESAFEAVTAAAYYPAGNSTWTEETMLDYGGKITWKAAEPLSIKTQPKTGYARMGEIVQVAVEAEGIGLRYQWYIKNADGTKYSRSSVTGPTYCCKMSEQSKGRRVLCIITDAYGNKVQSNTVLIREKVSITTEPSNTYVKAGSTAKITVKASGDGLKYQWYIKNAGQTKYSKSSITSATYSCKLNDKSKDRLICCVVTDQYGNTVQSKTVIIREAASIIRQPQNASAANGETICVALQAAGDGLKYQWYVKNEGGTRFSKSTVTSATYRCKMSDASNGRQIYCVITDAYGRTATSDTVTLSRK